MSDSTAGNKTFDNLDPKKNVTDPQGIGAQGGGRFPAHLYKWAPESDETTNVVAWKNKQPIHNAFTEAADQAALDALLAEGWSEKPVLEAPAPKASRAATNGSGKKD